MRRRAAITAAVALVGFVGASLIASPAVAQRAHRSRCLPHGGKPVAEDRTVRVYALAANTPAEHTYGCALRTGRTVLLEGHGRIRFHQVKLIALAGNFAAFVDSQHGIDTGCTTIGVVDVLTGATFLELPAGCWFLTEGEHVADLVTNERGCVAWIVESTRFRTGASHRSQTTFEVWAATGWGSNPLLGSGAQIDPHSLRLAPAGEVSWLDAGSPQYSSLPTGCG